MVDFLSGSPSDIHCLHYCDCVCVLAHVFVHVVHTHAYAHMCEPLWSGHLIPVRLLDDSIGCAVFPPTAVLWGVLKCVYVCVRSTMSDIVVVLHRNLTP